jgi:D-alanine-D-alanine ligase
MRIGITYDLKAPADRPDLPDDFQEEFDSPATVEAIACALRRLGHDVQKLGDGRELLERLLADPPDFVFNIAEGQGVGRSREARVPAVLEMLGIPYTGSDPLTLAATLDKDCAKRLVRSAGVAVPEGVVIEAEGDAVLGTPDSVRSTQYGVPGAQSSVLSTEDSVLGARYSESRTQDSGLRTQDAALGTLPFPVIVKPAWEGSSKGIRSKCLVDRPADLPGVVEWLRSDHRQPVLVEEYVEGDELTVGVLGNDPPEILGVMRVLPVGAKERFIYSLEVKRDYERQVRYECPARLTEADTEAVRRSALAAYRVLGCRDVARIDFRLRGGVPYFLEVNPLPGLDPESSDLVIMAGRLGWSHDELIGAVLRHAQRRQARTATTATTASA